MNQQTQVQPVTFLERVAEGQRLWKFILPDVPSPPNLTWVRWLSMGTDREVEKAIAQIPFRYQKGLPEMEEIYKFVSALLSAWRSKKLRHIEQQRNQRQKLNQQGEL
jgi:hypothetical protein